MKPLIKQITVFLPNKPGKLAAMSHAVADAGVQIHALMVSETTDYGTVRLIVDMPDECLAALKDAGYAADMTEVIAVPVDNVPGGLARVLDNLTTAGLDVGYAYCCSIGDTVVDILKVTGEPVLQKLRTLSFPVLGPDDLLVR